MSDEEIIRKFEREILDQLHTALPFYQFSDDVIIPYLLQSYGDFERHSQGLLEKGYNEVSLGSFLHK